jgi:hypothetical protein
MGLSDSLRPMYSITGSVPCSGCSTAFPSYGSARNTHCRRASGTSGRAAGHDWALASCPSKLPPERLTICSSSAMGPLSLRWDSVTRGGWVTKTHTHTRHHWSPRGLNHRPARGHSQRAVPSPNGTTPLWRVAVRGTGGSGRPGRQLEEERGSWLMGMALGNSHF